THMGMLFPSCLTVTGLGSGANCRKARYPAITAGMTEPTSAQDLFKGRHFDQEIIILCVRWYITFKLSFRDLVQMMAERGITCPIRLFFGGCSSMSPSLKSAGIITHGQSATPGVWMKPTSKSKANGSTSIAPSTF